ncbi:hypothetical protein MCEMSEM47_01842 [Burkholderiales bacterium]
MDSQVQSPPQRRAPGWFLLAASLAGIALVLFQMSNDQFTTLRPDPSPPVVEPTPPLWTPKSGTTSDQLVLAPSPQATPEAASLAPATPTSAPRAPLAAAPVASSSNAEPAMPTRAPLPSERVRVAIDTWAQAWRTRDIDAYLDFYDASFDNRTAFARQKQRVMGRAQFIEIKIAQLKLTPLSNGSTEARFLQTYRSDTFENQTLKRQVWQAGSDGRLRIVEETS